MADEYNDQDLYGSYDGYESEGDTPASLSAMVAAFRNLIVNSAMIENLAVQDGHIQSVSAEKIVAGEIMVDSNNLAFNALLNNGANGWVLSSPEAHQNTSLRFMGYMPVKVESSGFPSGSGFRGAIQGDGQKIPVQEGDKLTASVYAYTDNIAGIDAGVAVAIEYYDSAGTRISVTSENVTLAVNGKWQRIKHTGTVPSGAINVKMRFYVTRNGTAWFAAPQLQRGGFLTPFTPNGTYIGPNGVMTTDIIFSGTLSGANGSFNGKLENTLDATKKVVIENGGIVTLNPAGNLNMSFGAYGINRNVSSGTFEAVMDTSGVYFNKNGHSYSLGATVEGANDALELYSSKGIVRSKTRFNVHANGSAFNIFADATATNVYQSIYVGATRYGFLGKASSASDEFILNADIGNLDLRTVAAGQITMRFGGTIKHIFKPDGTKSGGSIEIDGENLGMSPLDSPQINLEYIAYGVDLMAEGTKVTLDTRFLKAVDYFAVFPNKGELVEQGADYFIIKGEGKADCRIIGPRKGYAETFWMDMSA